MISTKKNVAATKCAYTFPDDNDSGISSLAADQVDLVAGGVVGVRATPTTTTINAAGTAVVALSSTVTLPKTVKVALLIASTNVLSWANPESVPIHILGVALKLTTASTGASTIDVGVTATDATTSDDTLMDGLSLGTAGNFCTGKNAGTNGKVGQTIASGKWITGTQASGDVTGAVGFFYITYIPLA